MEDKFNRLLQLIDLKASKEDLSILSNTLFDNLNETIKNCIDRFVDKKDFAHRFSSFEK